MKNRWLYLFLSVLLGSACTFDYREAQAPEEMDIPNIVLEGFRQTVVSNGAVVLRIQVDRAESFERKRRTIFYNVRFSEYDEQGNLLTEGRAGRVEFETDTQNAVASEDVVIHSHREEGRIQAETLTWNYEVRTLSSGAEERVRVEDEEGSWIEGVGFNADLRRLLVTFDRSVRGAYVAEEE